MTLPIALQTYTVREPMSRDFDGTIRRIAAMGYGALETTFEIPGTTWSKAASLFRELGLRVPAAHTPLPLGKNQGPVLDFARQMGLSCLVAMHGPNDFKRIDQIRHICDEYNQAAAVAARHGLGLAYHNHWWEFQTVEGRLAFDVMLEHLDPAVGFEIDTYWVQTAGHDPAAVVQRLGGRAPLLHIKDGPATVEDSMVAVGQGVLDFHAIVAAASGAQWLIVELDRCATDMLVAVEQSHRYLVQEGLGHGA
ncbi:MAG: sugar phosphate isomerase/epimerase [Anaerolineae bacterium]|jgi:sugar phosphate isomerase/epimerase